MLNYIKKILIGTPAEKVKMTSAEVNMQEMKIKTNRNIVRTVIFATVTAISAGAGWWFSAGFCGVSTLVLAYTVYFNKRLVAAMQKDEKKTDTVDVQLDMVAGAV